MRAFVSRAAFALFVILPQALDAQWWGGCRDVLGTPVLDYSDFRLNDIAMATIAGGQPVILYNPQVLVSVSPQTRRFFYFHECGHHALGQVISGQNIPYVSEQAADCWAARALIESGEFTSEDLEAVQRDVSRSPGDWTHLPGPQRALNLVACLGGDGRGSGRCRAVTEWEERTVWVTQLVPQSFPCSHWGCGYYGCGYAHPYDVVNVPQQVPVTERVPVERMRCD